MNNDDREILKAVQKNADMAIKAIGIVSEKTRNTEFSQELAKEKLMYSVIQNKATDRLNNEELGGYNPSAAEDMLLAGGIHMSTLTNCSTGKLAELVIQHSNRGLTGMWKSINHHQNYGNTSMEIAKEFMTFEEKTIARLKKFL
ncbi:MAG: hypothetical protein K2N89_04280 [Lachnospiraceae bacterium]|nr:hypothetical protein [Lachnospiraceae bacterium]